MPAKLRRQLTSVGRTTLVTEIDTNRSIVAGCLLFDGILKKQDVIDRFNKELLKFDRFQSIVVDNQSYFELIPNFDCKELFSEKQVTKEELGNDVSLDSTMNYIEELLSSFANVAFKMTSTKPMWRVHLYHFEDGKYTAMIFRMHHCICDGITLGTVFNRITDDFQNKLQKNIKPENNGNANTKLADKKMKKQKGAVELVLYFVFFWIFGLLACLWKLIMFTLQPEPERFVVFCFLFFVSILILCFSFDCAVYLINSLINFSFVVQCFCFLCIIYSLFKPNKLSEHKHVAFISNKVPLSNVNAQRAVINNDQKYQKSKLQKPTFNDFIIGIIAQSMSLFLKKKNMPVPEFVRLGIPVNIRADAESHGKDTILGNKIGSYIIKLPLSHSLSFIDKLIVIKKELDWVKKTPESKLSHYATKLVSNLPQSMSKTLASYMSGKNTLVVSNVRGPDKPLILYDKKCIVLAGPVPPPVGVALGFAVFTYQKDVMISVNIDDCVAGHDGATLFKQCILEVLKQQNCGSHM